MQAQVDALVKKRQGGNKSLFDVGYAHIGLDDCWQRCTTKTKKDPSQIARNASGYAIIDETK